MIDLAVRSDEAEWMDGDVAPETFAALLADLVQVNTVTLARRPTIGFVKRALRNIPIGEPITILDVGFGDGDMLRALASHLRHRPKLRLIGCDINPRSEPVARSRTPPHLPIAYVTGDAFSFDPAQPVDLIISSLVTHHMTDIAIIRFLRWMEARATLGWLVNDLHRSAIAYHGFRALAAAARWHPIVRHDGAVSVARAFTKSDWIALLDRAGIELSAVDLRWHLPFRWCVERRR